MQNVSEFVYLTLNTNSMYSSANLATIFTNVLNLFHTYLTQQRNNQLANHVNALGKIYQENEAAGISYQLQNLAIGEIKLFRNHILDSKLFIYKFKKESQNSLSLTMYRLNLDTSERTYEPDLYKRVTKLESHENSEVITYHFTLENCQRGDELTRLIKILLTLGSNYSDGALRTCLAFLNPTITIKTEQYPPELLQSQTFFIRTMYRLLEECVPCSNTLELEQRLVHFVRDTILKSSYIATKHPELYRNAITNHIVYFQYTNCENEQTKRNNTVLLKNELTKLPAVNTFNIRISNKNLQLTTLDTTYYHNPLKTSPPRQNRQQNYQSQAMLPTINFIKQSVSDPLRDAKQFCQDLNLIRQNQHASILNIEYFILRCPLPIQTDKKQSPIYLRMRPEEWKELGVCFETIGKIYIDAIKNHLKGQQTPKVWITLSSIILCRAYCHQYEKTQYSLSTPVICLLNNLLSKMKMLPHMSTYHPEFDQRWETLCDLCDSASKPYYYLSSELKNIYQELLEKTAGYAKLKTETQEANKITGEKKKTELEYYLSSSAVQQKYPDAAQKFQQAFELETFFSSCFAILTLSTRFRTTSFSYNYSSFETPLSDFSYRSLEASSIKENAFVTTSKENCAQDSLISIALRKKYIHAVTRNSYNAKPYSSNTVQTTAQFGEKNRSMVPEDMRLRQLLQFGLKDNPIPLVLNHYFSKIQDLSAVEVQYFVLENLLSGQALLPYLKSPLFASYLTHFDAFIEKGLKQFENQAHHLTQTSLAFIQLALLVNIYMAIELRRDPDDRLQKLLQRLNDWIKIHHANHAISASLHQYRLSLIITLEQLSLANNDHFADAFISYGYLKIHSNDEKTLSFVEKTDSRSHPLSFPTLVTTSICAKCHTCFDPQISRTH